MGALAVGLVASCSSAGTAPTFDAQSPTETATSAVEPQSSMSAPATTTSSVEPYPLPSSQSRNEVPWDEVGGGWYVVLYDSTNANPTSEADFRQGPVALYLVDGHGNRYEITAWSPGSGPDGLVDAWSTKALVVGRGVDGDERMYQVVDLGTGEATPVYSVGFPENSYHIDWELSLTRPSAANLVVYSSDGVSERLDRRSPDGHSLANLYTGSYEGALEAPRWLYGHEGTSVLVSSSNGIRRITNTGSDLGRLWVPADSRCDPVRWWDVDTFLGVCYLRGDAAAPHDPIVNPYTHYGQLWLLKTDGASGVPLTGLPRPPPTVSDFGFRDAWPGSETTLLQWTGDCGAANIAALEGDGAATFINVSLPPLFPAGVKMVDIVDLQIAAHIWQSCDGSGAGLFALDENGAYLHDLVPLVGDAIGVTGAVGLASLVS